ncbi:choice-of-anchor M domain-containing protein [Nesterenkonia alba]|uniref:choice-of-anchor M domain-containing protein n=1 Tax=Nesterenkonia alba TaxID=515814 RepID=UPI0003B3ABAC|nr:choice-of-anchor M domain-containing protein [Nesterenkonia alba]
MSHPETTLWRRLLTAGAAAGLLLTTAGTTAAVATEEDDPLDQTVERDEEVGEERVVLERGHVDLGPRLIDGEWQLMARDDSIAPPVWRFLDDMVFHMRDASIQQAPDDEQYDFIPAEPGEDLYLIPQTEDYDVPWLGWNTQDPDVVEQLVRGMSLRLHAVDGPGDFTLFLQSGNFDPPQQLWDSTTLEESGAQDIWADTNTHVHGNWVFTEPGIYLLDVEVLGDLDDGTEGADRAVLRFAVGEDTDPHEAFEAELSEDAVEAGDQGEDTDIDTGEAGDTAAVDEDGLPLATVAIVVGVGVILLGGAALAVGLRSRRAKQAAEEEVSATGARRGHD